MKKSATPKGKTLALTHHFQITDDFERAIQNEILAPILDKDTFTILNFKPKEGPKTAEKYFRCINSVAYRLLQAYKHFKNYSVIEAKLSTDLLSDIKKTKRYIDERWRPLELSCEIDAFLTKWKATLDVLVKSLIPLFGTKTLLFNRDNKYEFKIVKEIETSLSKNKKIKLSNLCSHIRSSADLIHKVIKLRDDVVHFDKECLTPFHYRLSEQKLYQPNLIWENKQYKPQDFMLQTIEFLRDFIRDFMIYSINGSIAGMSLVIKDGSHQWYMPKNKLNTEK